MSKELLGDRAIGMINLKLSALCVNGGGETTHDLWYGQTKVGEVKFASLYTTSAMQQLSYGDINESQSYQLLEDQLTKNNYDQYKNEYLRH